MDTEPSSHPDQKLASPSAIRETLAVSETTPWQVQITAKYTLKEWRAGKLNLDW
jgi:hypothetical protein